MSDADLRFLPTPNPDAIKCVVGRPLGQSMRSYRSRADAGADPLALALFDIPGVVGVLIAQTWLTLNRAPGTEWDAIKPRVLDALRAHAPAA
jgi:hypothetical protein